MKESNSLERVDFDGILFKILIKFAGEIKDETLSLGIDSPTYPVKPVFSAALYQLRDVIKAAEQQASDDARGCVDCKKLRCENCERLWQT